MSETTDVGLFLLKLEIGSGMAGAPTFRVALTVNTVDERVNGQGLITQATNPPLQLRTELHGSFTYMTVMPKNTHILLIATGYPPVHMPPHSGIGPVIMPNADLRAVLDAGWTSGTASFKYLDSSGKWVEIKDVPVRAAQTKL